ncbi:MAG: 30S ribosomal protein S8 [Phycisphaerales bacterium]|mgnify:FL=1|nr:30S ribosomal protein S8 [Phycisphaerales bacterium]
MSVNDPISDMLTRIRNALRNRARTVDCLNSKVCRGVAQVLQDEGYVEGFNVVDDGRQGVLRVSLRYGAAGEPLIASLQRVSKPGRRVYSGVEDLPRPLQGMGIAVVSTSRGVMSDRKCRTERVGGELLAVVQ